MLKLIEVALLGKHGHVRPSSMVHLERRLAELLNPAGVDSKSTQLNVIDQWLSMKNGEAVIGEAFNIIKPVFLAQVQ